MTKVVKSLSKKKVKKELRLLTNPAQIPLAFVC
jgi:hypothetical protein